MKWATVYPTVEMIKQKVNRRENINNKKDIKMKKKIFSAAFAVVIMAVAGYNVYMNQAKSKMSELALANIEALADPEGNVTTKYVKNINIKDLGKEDKCINGYFCHILYYQVICVGEGNLPCQEGTFARTEKTETECYII